MEIIHLLLVFLFIFCSFLVFITDNPVHSVIFLILVFCNSASILFIFNIDFLGILFIIIYVGAIAVLFLFVIMMLSLKIYTFDSFMYLPILFLGSIIIFLNFYLNLDLIFDNTVIFDNTFNLFDSFNNIDIFGQSLYNYFLICFLISGLILLVAMVGAIILTLNFCNKKNKELFFKQLSRSENFISFSES